MIYCFDIDNTLCYTESNFYEKATPHQRAIDEVNRLYEEGHTIQLFTARGAVSGKDWTVFTRQQMKNWGVNHHELIMNKKPHFDLLIDDKAKNAIEWRKNLKPIRGILAGSFDLIHPGYIKMFKDSKNVCDHLIVALQTDPTIDRPTKNKPVQTLVERKMVLEAISYVDEILVYDTEQSLYNLLESTTIDVRILGSDYKGLPYTGDDLGIPIYYHTRDHEWSTTALKNKIRSS